MEYTIVEYVWIGGCGELRSKTRVFYEEDIYSVSDLPIWTYDGSSTEQADGSASEVFLHPKRMFRCPFRRPNGMIVMCDTYLPDGTPARYNHRHDALKIFEKYADQKPWHGLEQEFFIYDRAYNQPFNFDPNGKQGQYYCSVGGNNAFMRKISDEHLEACLYAGIKIMGTNAEVAPSQWEYQIFGEGIDAADQLWISRYILERISEKYNSHINYHPKPLKGDWNGSGCHCNFSIEAMRNKDGINAIMAVMPKLEAKHSEHMLVYGKYNRERMTEKHETSSYDKFTYGIGSRNTSVRVPNDAVKGINPYLEDRRPAGNCDPYLVTSKILQTIME